MAIGQSCLYDALLPSSLTQKFAKLFNFSRIIRSVHRYLLYDTPIANINENLLWNDSITPSYSTMETAQKMHTLRNFTESPIPLWEILTENSVHSICFVYILPMKFKSWSTACHRFKIDIDIVQMSPKYFVWLTQRVCVCVCHLL